MTTLAIDPGPEVSGWAILRDGRPVAAGLSGTPMLLDRVRCRFWGPLGLLAVERIRGGGPRSGRAMFDTAWTGGELYEAGHGCADYRLAMTRSEVLRALGVKAGKGADSRVRTAMIERFGGPVERDARGSVKAPAWAKAAGLKSHAWQALGLAVAAECVHSARRR